jgi:hypothetical protein
MLEDLYLRAVIGQHRAPESADATAQRMRRELMPRLERWGGRYLEAVTVSGSFAKGTAIRNPSLVPCDVDVDLLLSLAPDAPGALAEWQESLAESVREYQPVAANVAVKILAGNTRVDLVAARRRQGGEEHTLWQARRATWLRTNVAEQIRYVRWSGRLDEILAVKIWRRRQALYFPSFCLELAVIHALAKPVSVLLSGRFLEALRFLALEFPETVLRDPANGSNVVSDLMSAEEKRRVAGAAEWSLRAERWDELL